MKKRFIKIGSGNFTFVSIEHIVGVRESTEPKGQQLIVTGVNNPIDLSADDAKRVIAILERATFRD